MNPILGTSGAVVAPHALASQAGLDILREGGNAIEATIAVAATLAVVYPHMTGIGGDGFWLLHAPGAPVQAIDACGAAGAHATPALYEGRDSIPWRGPLAACTVAGTLSGWGLAYAHSRSAWGGRLPFSRLLESAIHYARAGFPVTHSQEANTRAKRTELEPQPGFAETFLPHGDVPAYGARHHLPALAATLEQLARAGAQDFYTGELARSIGADLEAVGSPVTLADLNAHRAELKPALETAISAGQIFNMPPPTQGLASLLILAIYDRIRQPGWTPDNAAGIHALVEATKQAFILRDRHIGDPAQMAVDPARLLDDATLDACAAAIALDAASPWPAPVSDGDTTWMGVIDREGRPASEHISDAVGGLGQQFFAN